MIDHTLAVLRDGYLHLSTVRERAGRDTVRLRLLGQRATCLVGPEATKFFYDAANFDRQGVVPPNVRHTLFGDAGVQLLDGPPHHRRKALFTTVLDRAGTDALVESVSREWDAAADGWRGHEVVLFDEAARVLARGVHGWAGVPLDEDDVPAVARDLVAMVDGFASLGGRYVRARRARSRQERRLAGLAEDIRSGRRTCRAGSPLEQALQHRDDEGALLDPHTFAVEMLNLLRPTVAVAWFVAYAAHALHYWPAERDDLANADHTRTVAFVHELRRFYPFAPFVGARAVRDLYFDGVRIPADSLVVLDVFGQNHHPGLWPDPWVFSSRRHLEQPPGMFDLVPQGGGDPISGHRCPGESATVQILAALVPRILALGAEVPEQDLEVTQHRIPARVRSDVELAVPVRMDGASPGSGPVIGSVGQSGAQQ